MSNRPWLTEALLLLVALIWGSNFTVVKFSLNEMPPLAFNAIRYFLGTGLMWGIILYRGETVSIARADLIEMAKLSLLGHLVYQMLFIYGVNYTNAANAAVVLGSTPVLMAVLSHYFFDEKLSTAKTAGVVTAFSGVVFIIAFGTKGLSFKGGTLMGDILVLLCALAFTVFTLMSKKFLKTYSPLHLTTVMMTMGSGMLITAGIPELISMDWKLISVPGYIGVAYSGMLSIAISYVIWNNGLKKVGAVRTATYQNLVPVVGLLFGVVLLKEVLTPMQYLGSAMVVGGIGIARIKRMGSKLKV